MIVVAVAVIGSLTVLPAVLSSLGDNVERLRVPFVHRLRRDGEEGRVWGAIVDRVLRRPGALGRALGRAAAAHRGACADPPHRRAGDRHLPAGARRAEDVQPTPAGVPGHRDPGERRRRGGRTSRRPRSRSAIGELERRAVATGLMQQPILVDVNSDRTVANVAIPIAGKGNDGPSNAALAALRRDIVPETIGVGPRRRGRRRRVRRGVEGLQRLHEVGRLVRVRLRARLRVPPPALRLPLARDRGEGDRPQPALRRGRLRDPRARLPARLGEAAARLRRDGRHRPVPPDLPVRDPVRALDGLPRVHPEPDQRGLRPRRHHRRSRLARDQDDRGRHHERRARHGLRLLGLRRALVHDLQADRRRARGRDPDRRDDRARRPAPRVDEAARRLELVPAELARVAASSRARRVDADLSCSRPRPRPTRRRSTVPAPVADDVDGTLERGRPSAISTRRSGSVPTAP